VEDVAGIPGVPLGSALSLVPSRALPERSALAEYFPVPERVCRAVGRRLRCDYRLAGRESASLERGPLKLIWSSLGEHELYDLASDPREETNLLPERAADAARLEAALLAWREALRAARRGKEDYEMDPATRKALESLGYVH
jgi:hypothetical protein